MIRAEDCVIRKIVHGLGICKLEGDMNINRDDLGTRRQDARVMSHAASKENFVDYLLMCNERNDSALQ